MLKERVLEQQIAEQMWIARVPGLALAVVRGQELIVAQGFGTTSVEDGGVPVTPQTLFRVGSITKALTTTAVMRLVEQGVLELDRLIADYVPWLALSQPGVTRQITLRMLLSHTAGLPTSHAPFGRRDPGGLEAYVRDEVPRYRFVAPPARLYAYSNPGVRIAGYIAQEASGLTYTELMQNLVFGPLEMERTTFDPTVAMTYPVAQSHDRNDDGRLSVQHRYADNSGGYPSGGAISTAIDLSHFAIMLMNGGHYRGRQVLAAESVAEMQKPQIDTYLATEGSYGLALAIERYKGVRRVGHDGSIGSFGTKLVMIPEAGTAVVLLFNRAAGFWRQAQAIADQILDQLLDLPPEAPLPLETEPDRARWPLYTGTYLGDWRGLAEVKAVGDQLFLVWNGEPIGLSALREDLYFGRRPGSDETISVGFVPEGPNPIRFLQIESSPCERFHLEGSPAPAGAIRADFAGRYSGVETLEIRHHDGRLGVYSEEASREMPAVPLSPSLFACDAGLLEFEGTGDGSVPALQFGRVYTLTRTKPLPAGSAL